MSWCGSDVGTVGVVVDDLRYGLRFDVGVGDVAGYYGDG